MVNFTEQDELFKRIGKMLSQKIEVYLIGGSAMLHFRAKAITKDIDVVTTSEKDLELLKKALLLLGFSIKDPFVHIKYQKIDVTKPIFLIFGEMRIDIFCKRILDTTLSETMKNRIIASYEYHNLVAHIVSPEDIILLKSVTEREGDRVDAKSLIQNYNIKWDILIEEATHQTELGELLFIVFLDDFLHELKEDLHADIPREVLKNIRKLAEHVLIEHFAREKKHAKKMSAKTDKRKSRSRQ